ncbi:MAG: hypothetical protein ABR608_16205, partial [Pseudonocardiaceae bacterium]
MPSLWRCRWPGSVEPDRAAVHRVLSQWLDTEHHAQRKPWSWSAGGSEGEILVGLLDDRLTERLVHGADAAGTPMRQVAAG